MRLDVQDRCETTWVDIADFAELQLDGRSWWCVERYDRVENLVLARDVDLTGDRRDDGVTLRVDRGVGEFAPLRHHRTLRSVEATWSAQSNAPTDNPYRQDPAHAVRWLPMRVSTRRWALWRPSIDVVAPTTSTMTSVAADVYAHRSPEASAVAIKLFATA